MKRTLFAIFLTLFCLHLSANWVQLDQNENLFQLNRSSSDQTEFTFHLNGYELEEIYEKGENYTRISHPLAGEILDIGKPDLPIFTTFIAIPDIGTPQISVENGQIVRVDNIIPYPRQELISESIRKDYSFVTDHQFYQNGEIFPSKQIEMGDPFIMRDLRIVPVVIKPFSYDPKTKKLDITTNVKISITTSGSGGINRKESSGKISKTFSKLYKSTVLNYVENNRDTEFQDPSYLFICPNNSDVIQYLTLLTDWKKEKGFNVTTATTMVTGTSLGSIKNYIQNAYDNWENPPEFVCLVGDAGGAFSIPTGHMDGGSYNGEGDHYYTELEGDDMIADIFIGRMSFNSISELQTVIAKIFNYEKTPYMGNTDWYDKAVVVGDPSASGPSTIDTKIYVETMMNQYAPNIEVTEVFSGAWPTLMTNNINDGRLFFNYRGFGGMSGWSNYYIEALNNGFMLPVATALTCNTGDFEGTWDSISEAFFKAGTPTSPKGAIAAISTATGNTHTCFNNCVDAGIYYGIFPDSLYNMGAALARGKLNLSLNYPGNPSNAVHQFSYWNNLMGDPGMSIWTGIPQQLSVSHPDLYNLNNQYLVITVSDPNNNPLKNAWVSLLAEDSSDPILYYTDSNGAVQIPSNLLEENDYKLTISDHNFIPYQADISMGFNAETVTTGEIIFDDSNGNNDQLPNPGEDIELGVQLFNYLSYNLDNVTAELSTFDEYINITNATCSYGSIQPGEQSESTNTFQISIAQSIPGNTPINLSLTISDGLDTWHDHIDLSVSGADIRLQEIQINNETGFIEPDSNADVSITVTNMGDVAAENFTATLSCENNEVVITNPTFSCSQLEPMSSIDNLANPANIDISVNMLPNMSIPITLTIEAESGLIQTWPIFIYTGEAEITDPLGPDAGGYYCYDDDDVSYVDAPVYNWIETNPDNGGAGTTLAFSDDGNGGVSETIFLPINFKFYDIVYDQLTICSNGWIAPGSTDSESFMNWTIPGSNGPSPIIAPFWDDLMVSENEVSYYHDAANNCFVVQWDNVSNEYNYAMETFQVILYDYFQYPAMNGNSQIKFQYKIVNNVDQGQYGWGVEHGLYATVGIENHLSDTGLQYTWNNIYPTSCKELEDEMAILFTGAPINQDEPYLVVNEIIADSGDENTQFDYGEDADVYIEVSNLGNNESGYLSATISCDDEYIEILNDTSYYTDIPGNNSAINDEPFEISVSEHCPDQHIVDMQIELSGESGDWILSLCYRLNAPNILYQSYYVDDENNLLDPGETADAQIYFYNEGGSQLNDIDLVIETDSGYVTISESDYEIDYIEAGSSNSITIQLTSEENTPIGHTAYLNWEITGAYNYENSGVFPIPVSMIPVSFEQHFDTFPPPGWETTGGTNWHTGEYGNAGGDEPEAEFSWTPNNNGIQRLISPIINTLGSFELELEFKNYISHFNGDYNLFIQTTSNGVDWHTAHQFPAESVSAYVETLSISTADVGSSEFQFAFVFDGNSYNINYWDIDDVYLSNGNSDQFGFLQGMISLNGGSGAVEDVEILAGPHCFNPDENGFFNIPLIAGLYEVTTTLEAYGSITQDVMITCNIISEMDVELDYLQTPVGFSGEVIEDDVYLNWDLFDTGRELTVSKDCSTKEREFEGLLLYRDGVCITGLMHQSDTTFVDLDLPNGVYEYYLTAYFDNGESDPTETLSLTVDFSDSEENEIPLVTDLIGNYPNPFHPIANLRGSGTTISFALNKADNVKIIIYNIRGEIVDILTDEYFEAAYHSIYWDGSNRYGSRAASGIYFYKMITSEIVSVKKMLLLR